MQRREFIKLNAGLALAPILIPSLTSPTKNVDYDIHEFKIGKYTGKIFKDLIFKYQGKDFFSNAPAKEVNQELTKYAQKTDNISSPFIALLLENGKEKILIDTGIGFSKEPVVSRGTTYQFEGKLMEVLKKANIDTKEITHVILTHFHPDHIGGIYNEYDTLNFPNAKFSMHEEEWNFWYSSKSDNQPPYFKDFIEKNITRLKNLNIELLKGKEAQILPTITAIQTPGHTPGQIALRIESQRDKLLYISDSFLHPLHIEHIDWQTNYDLDHQLAKATRINLLELAHQENMPINAFHFDFPGMGQVEKSGNNWKWVYSNK
jgi:glyoxylase-like metal-dependent hydrolase (beta-lactamase superfamily II)